MGDEQADLAPGTAAFVARRTPWRVDDAEGLAVLSVLVREPLPAQGHAVLDVTGSEADSATAGRMFRLLATPEVGCASVTQFVGYIPAGRAPDHFHTYDEVVYVLEGEGALHIGGERAPLQPGSACTCPRGSCTASRTRAQARCRCSASSAPPARRRRRTTPTERGPSTDAAHRAHGRDRLGGQRRPRRGHDRRGQRRVLGSPLLAGDADRAAGGQDEPRGAARRRARRLHHDVAGERAHGGRHAARPARRRLPHRHGRGRGAGPPDRRLAASTLVAAVDGLDDAALQAAVAKADEGCPFSALLRRAGADVQVTARLA